MIRPIRARPFKIVSVALSRADKSSFSVQMIAKKIALVVKKEFSLWKENVWTKLVILATSIKALAWMVAELYS